MKDEAAYPIPVRRLTEAAGLRGAGRHQWAHVDPRDVVPLLRECHTSRAKAALVGVRGRQFVLQHLDEPVVALRLKQLLCEAKRSAVLQLTARGSRA